MERTSKCRVLPTIHAWSKTEKRHVIGWHAHGAKITALEDEK